MRLLSPWWVLTLLLAPCVAARAADAASSCTPAAPLLLTVRIGSGAARQALLIGGNAPALRVVDAHNGEILWTAGAASGVSQRFAAMSASFTGSLVALDTDHDGLDDRLYAGDLAGRLWRFDLHNGATADAWASGGVFADFSNDAGRGFHAPPDVSQMNSPGAAPWFDIALGTAAPGHVDANNRFYVLRDYAPFDAWSDAAYRDWQPLQESDLLRVNTAAEPSQTAAEIHAGWYIELGAGDVLTASMTVAGRAVLAIAEPATNPATGCRSAFSIATLDLTQAQPLRNTNGDWRTMLSDTLATDTDFALTMSAGEDATLARCSFGDTHVAACDVDTRPHRTWWRREDAE